MSNMIVFASGKGGVGKSTVTANVSTAASQLGKEILMIDTDIPMASLSLSLGLDIDGPTLNEVLSGDYEIDDVIYDGPGGTRVIPAGISLDDVRKAKPQKLKELMKEVSERFGTVVVDPPPGLGTATLTVLKACDRCVLVSIPVVNCLTDVLRTKRVCDKVDTEVEGVVVSRALQSDTDVPEEEIEAMLDTSVLGVIPEDTEVRRSASVGDPVVVRNPDCPSSKVFKSLAKKVFFDEED